MKNQKNKEIELLNYEGPVLKAIRVKDTFIILDEDKKIIEAFDINEMEEFLFENKEIVDSRGRAWEYLKQHEDARQSPEKLIEFLGKNFREIDFNSNLNQIAAKLLEVPKYSGDLSDIGNEIGYAIGSVNADLSEYEIKFLISGINHGISLTNGTHN